VDYIHRLDNTYFCSLLLFIMLEIFVDDVTLFYLIMYMVNHVKI